MGDFAWSAFYRHHRRKINVVVATTLFLVLLWPVPIIVSKIDASKFQHKCEGLWQGNAASFEEMEAAKNEVDYVGSGLNFTQEWTGNPGGDAWAHNQQSTTIPQVSMGNTLEDRSCFQNLYPVHLRAIQHLEGALLEYSRQSQLANFDMAPPGFDYPQFSKVQYRCAAPGLWNHRWSTWCETFLNVPSP